MDSVVIVLLVLLGVIILTKGKPLWSWMKEKGSWIKDWWNGKNELSTPMIIMIVMIVLIGLWTAFGTICTVAFVVVVAYLIVKIAETIPEGSGPPSDSPRQ